MPEPRKRDLLPRSQGVYQSSRMVEYIDSEGVTRYKLLLDTTSLTEEVKATFLEELANHGRYGTAARLSGISMKTVKKHIEKNPQFGEAAMEALECYKDRLIAHHQNLVFNGTVKITYGRDGSIVSEETIYPVRLIELELKKHDEGYRDKRDVSVNVTGGVLVAPAQVTMDDWEKKFGSPSLVGDIIDAVVVDSEGEDYDDADGED